MGSSSGFELTLFIRLGSVGTILGTSFHVLKNYGYYLFSVRARMRTYVRAEVRGQLSGINTPELEWVLGMELRSSDMAQVPFPPESPHQFLVELFD